jgi:molybdenum cofactor cytidylyltransferase
MRPDVHVAGVVLAAGASTRMGRNKLLLCLDGESLVVRAVRRAAEAGLDPVVVVLGHEAERVARELAGLPCSTVVNPDHVTGQASSFRTGIGAVPAEADAAVVLLSDMPHVTPAMIAALVARFWQTRAPLVVSEYGGVQAPPTLYARSLFDEILAMTGDACGRRLVAARQADAQAVAWPAERLADLDEPGDVESLRAGAAEKTPCVPSS